MIFMSNPKKKMDDTEFDYEIETLIKKRTKNNSRFEYH